MRAEPGEVPATARQRPVFRLSFARVVAAFPFAMHGGIRCPTLAVKVEDVRRSPFGFASSGLNEAEVANACLGCVGLVPVHQGQSQVYRLGLDRQRNLQRDEQEGHV
jgi:hypothetical protein